MVNKETEKNSVIYCTSAYVNRNSFTTTLNLFAITFSPVEKLIPNWERSSRL